MCVPEIATAFFSHGSNSIEVIFTVLSAELMWYKLQKKISRMSEKDKIHEIEMFLCEFTKLPDRDQNTRNKIKCELDKLKNMRSSRHKTGELSVRKQGIAQLVIVGPPNIGKSSLLSRLSEIQIKVGDFDFTTLRPTPAIIKLYGNEIQLVEIPGLIEGASEGKGNGRALISVIRNADGIILMTDITKSFESLKTVTYELEKSGIPTENALVICNKIELAEESKICEFKKAFEGHNVIPVSVKASVNLNLLKQEIWKLTGMVKIYSKPAGKEKQFPPLALKEGSSVADFVTKIHKDFARNFAYARVWGASAKFPGQEVGLAHILMDEDAVEVHLKR